MYFVILVLNILTYFFLYSTGCFIKQSRKNESKKIPNIMTSFVMLDGVPCIVNSFIQNSRQ